MTDLSVSYAAPPWCAITGTETVSKLRIARAVILSAFLIALSKRLRVPDSDAVHREGTQVLKYFRSRPPGYVPSYTRNRSSETKMYAPSNYSTASQQGRDTTDNPNWKLIQTRT